MPPGVGVLTCHHQIPCVSPLNLAWGSGDVVDRCFTHKFLYYCHIYKKVECYCILIAKCISEIYLLITMIYKISAYHFRPCIAKGTMSIVNCTKINIWVPVLAKKIEPAFEGIEIINLTLHSLQTEVEVIAANPST